MASVNYLGRIQLDKIHTQATNKTTAQHQPVSQHLWTVDCLWSWEELQVHHCSWDCQSSRSWPMCGLANVPRLHWLWQDVLFWRQGQENCMGHLDQLWRRHTSILRLGCHARPTCHWRVDATTAAICSPAVRSHQHRGGCEPGKETAVQQERQSYWWSASYTGCTHPTHQERCLLSWSLLGPNDDPCSRAPVTKWMGLEQKAWWWMEYNLNDLTRSIRGLQGTLAMWLQERLQRTLQTSEGISVQLFVSAVDSALSDAAHREQFITVWTQCPSYWLALRP